MKRFYWPLVGYVVVVFVVMGRALVPGSTEMIWGDDIHRHYYFYRQFFSSFLREGIWSWWNPYTFSGTPFIANPIVNIWYPPTWMFFFLPLTIAYSWHVALHLLLAMLGMYVLIRRMSQIGQIWKTVDLGSWVAGLVFGLSGFFSARIWAGHVDVIAAASWLPWVVWAFTRRGVVVAAMVFAMQLLAGYQTMAFFTMQAVFIFTLFQCYIIKSFRPLLRMMLAALMGVGLAGIQIIPIQEFFTASIRTFDFPYSWNSYGSLSVESLKQFFSPFVFGDQLSYRGPSPNYAEHAFFVGRASLVVIAIGIFLAIVTSLKKGKSDIRPVVAFTPSFWVCAVIAIFGLWVSLGPNAPIDLQYRLWKIVPMYKYLRIPPRHLILVVFGLSGMIGLTLKRFKQPFVFFIAAAISVEMILYAKHFITLKPIPEMRHDVELINVFSPPRCRTSFTSGVVDNDCLYRVLPNFGVWIPPRDSFDFNAAMQYRIFNASGYDPSILRRYYEFIDIANGQEPGASILDHDVQVPYLNVFSPATDVLNIKYILVPRAYDPIYGVKTDRFVLLREDLERDYRLYENKSVKPRFFIENGTVTVQKYTPNEIVIKTDTSRDATLMSSEVFYPGWEGFVDGKQVEVMKEYQAFRALFVPAGRHTVVFRYKPLIFWVGGIVSLASLGITCYIFFRSMSSSHNHTNS